MKLRHEKMKKFVEDMVSHRTLALWVSGDVANRAKFDLRPVRQDLQSLVNRCKVPVHDTEGVPHRVTIASRRANIRTRPDVKSDVLGQATEGLSFLVVSEEGECLKINYADRTGWVHLAVTERGKERNVKHPQSSVDPSVTGASKAQTSAHSSSDSVRHTASSRPFLLPSLSFAWQKDCGPGKCRIYTYTDVSHPGESEPVRMFLEATDAHVLL